MKKTGNETWFRGQPKPENQVGYCHNHSHLGYLSANAVKQHQCLGKQCKYFEKYEDHPYWKQREKVKELRKARKKRLYG